jgi:uncharacterized protein (UPF0210 family)
MDITPQEVSETLAMVTGQNLDLRTITMGISLASCADEDMGRMCDKIYDRITHQAEHLVSVADDLAAEYGIPIANKRVSVTPVTQVAACCADEDLSPIAHAMDRAAQTLGIDFMGGFSALVQKGIGNADRRLINSVPEALATTASRARALWPPRWSSCPMTPTSWRWPRPSRRRHSKSRAPASS